MTTRPRVLFLCTGNACRSQMAEGWARHLHAGRLDACSAGTEPQGLNPLAVRAMREADVDISGHSSKEVEDCDPDTVDLVVTVCDRASEACPAFSGAAKIVHHGFDDPPHLAKMAPSDDEAMIHYRRVRDEIRDFVARLPELLQDATTGSARATDEANR